ncbi:MAG TPA: MFS transporter [Roseiflexaceae bacterium]|nr:MFS transporter [Roseiflexaceae bacterium]
MLTLLRQRNFFLLWLGGLISFVGDWVLFIALPVYVYDLTGSALATGAMFMAQTTPRLLFGSLAGVFVDRWDRKRTMIIANLLSAGALLLLLPVRSAGDLWLLYLAAFLQASMMLFFQPAESALLPSLAGEGHLVHANALIALNWELTRLVAPPLGGLIMTLFGIGSVIALDSGSFLLSAALIALIAQPAATDQPPAAQPANRAAGALHAVWHELVEGLRLVRQDRLVHALFIITGVAMVAEGLINVLGFPWLKQVLHGDALVRGWMTSAQAIGGLIGGLLIGRVSRRVPTALLIGLSGIVLGVVSLTLINVTVLPIDQALGLPAALALKLLQGVPIIGLFISIDTLLQKSVADRYRGRIFGAYGAISALTMLFGQAAASLLGDRVGLVRMLDGMGAMYLLAGICALLLLRGQHEIWRRPALQM